MANRINFEKYQLDMVFAPIINPLRSAPEFKVLDMSSKGEDCGLYCLQEADLIENNFAEIRKQFGLGENRISGLELAKICNLHSASLLIIQTLIDQNFQTNNEGDVLHSGSQFEFYLPVDVIHSVILLNDHGHFNLVKRADDRIILPREIIDIFKAVPGNNYQEMCQTIFTEFEQPIVSTSLKLQSMYNM